MFVLSVGFDTSSLGIYSHYWSKIVDSFDVWIFFCLADSYSSSRVEMWARKKSVSTKLA